MRSSGFSCGELRGLPDLPELSWIQQVSMAPELRGHIQVSIGLKLLSPELGCCDWLQLPSSLAPMGNLPNGLALF